MNFRINEAIRMADDENKQELRQRIAMKLFPHATPVTRTVNLSNLANGRTTRIKPEWVQIICDECGCDANFLLDYQPKENEEARNAFNHIFPVDEIMSDLDDLMNDLKQIKERY